MTTPMPVIRTPIGMHDFALALIRVLRSSGVTATKEAAGVFWAQYALETGAGGFCWNHNLFNHKATVTQVAAGVPYMMLAGTWEIEHGKKIIYQPPHPATWFRAYASFEAAMSEHLAAIKTGRYASSWAPLLAGDVRGYATELRAHGYYTASLESYVDLLAAKLKDWMRSSDFERALEEHLATSERETEPEIRVVDQPIVYGYPPPLESTDLDESEPPPPPDEAA